MRKSKKLIIYEDKSTGTLFIRATKVNKYGEFVLKSDKYGVAKGKNTSEAELGRFVREVLKNCE